MRIVMKDYQKYGEYSGEQCSRAEHAKTAIVFLMIGAGLGTLLAMLLAPRSGPELRRAVQDKFDDARRGLGEQASRVRRRATEIAGQAREKVKPISNTR
jgi:gas vesicle protein